MSNLFKQDHFAHNCFQLCDLSVGTPSSVGICAPQYLSGYQNSQPNFSIAIFTSLPLSPSISSQFYFSIFLSLF